MPYNCVALHHCHGIPLNTLIRLTVAIQVNTLVAFYKCWDSGMPLSTQCTNTIVNDKLVFPGIQELSSQNNVCYPKFTFWTVYKYMYKGENISEIFTFWKFLANCFIVIQCTCHFFLAAKYTCRHPITTSCSLFSTRSLIKFTSYTADHCKLVHSVHVHVYNQPHPIPTTGSHRMWALPHRHTVHQHLWREIDLGVGPVPQNLDPIAESRGGCHCPAWPTVYRDIQRSEPSFTHSASQMESIRVPERTESLIHVAGTIQISAVKFGKNFFTVDNALV